MTHLLVQAQIVKHLAHAALTVELLQSKRRQVPGTTGTHAQQLRLGRQIKEAIAIRDAWNDVLNRITEDDVAGVSE